MANPRQRRKQKSKVHRAVKTTKQQSLKKQPGECMVTCRGGPRTCVRSGNLTITSDVCTAIKGPKAIQDAWDAKKTVRQNYAALGLTASLEPNEPGGTEHPKHVVPPDSSEPRTVPSVAISSKLPKGFGRIVRDANREVVRIELHDEQEQDPHRLTVAVGDRAITSHGYDNGTMDVELDLSEVSVATKGIGIANSQSETEVVRALEELAKGSSKAPRHASAHEVVWLKELVARYGDDVGKMARDRKLNVWQKTAGELTRAIAKAGGLSRLTR